MRRTIVTLALAAAAAAFAGGCDGSKGNRFAGLDGKKFYDAAGKFDAEAAKKVYLDFMAQAGYPVTDDIAKKLFVTDFALGRFTEAGRACIVWWGDQKYNFSSLDAFLLPGQIIPEHWHVKQGDIPEKMEAWLCRYGEIYGYAEGDPTPDMKAKLAAADAANITMKHETVLKVGDIAGIKHPLEKHWMAAGPTGLIFSEFSTYHTGEAVKFTDGEIKF